MPVRLLPNFDSDPVSAIREIQLDMYDLAMEIYNRDPNNNHVYIMAAKWQDLGDYNIKSFNITGHPQNLYDATVAYEESIVLGKKAIEAAVTNTQLTNCWLFQAARLKSFWDVLRTRKDFPFAYRVLNAAINAYHLLLHLVARGDPVRIECLHNGSILLGERYEIYGNSADLRVAIRDSTEALESCDRDSAAHSTILGHMSILYVFRFDRYRVRDDLLYACYVGEKSIRNNTAPCSTEERTLRTFNLANTRRTAWRAFGDIEQLQDAKRELEEAMVNCEVFLPRMEPIVIIRLATIMKLLGDATDDHQMSTDAVAMMQDALDAAREQAIEDPSWDLHSRALTAQAAYEFDGGKTPIEAIYRELRIYVDN
jgi:hypothetical protein